ncbi:amidase [Spirulina sp. CS-785/01]|uniref:amidase n=1 Tax=Spirulina sp. CS-785/01 TaxID=3021716 RepID=UPI00232AAEA8|nr:amidase [Spirulina sp. CS-785/01]MDB9311559.1 amidase [Spirulina sp. CS-785/01]
MTSTNYAFTSALKQAELIRTKQLSPLELTQLYLDRIERLDPQLGSFVTVAKEQAIADATRKTEHLTQTPPSNLPPFFGVPISIKDLNPVAGLPQMCGTLALKDNIPQYDDGIVSKLKAAGCIILGKTATPEVGSFPYTEPPGFPPTRNPWQLDYTPGGSSGGSASAVAAGLCAIGQGSDGGGSIRTPASCCGLVGLKPSRGRVSNAPIGEYPSGIATQGVLTRTVAETAAFLDVISGYITGDPYWLPDPEIPFAQIIQQPVKPLKIALSTTIPTLGTATAPYQQAVTDTAQHLENAGHTLEEACPDLTGLAPCFTRVWQAGIAASGLPLEAFSPINRWLVEQAGTAGEYLQAAWQLQALSRRIVAFFDQYDLLLLPVHLHTPPKIGEWADLSPEETLQRIIQWIGPCPLANATGLPAISIPTTFDPQGIPLGIQLVGKPASDGLLLQVAAQLEQLAPWTHRPSMAT